MSNGAAEFHDYVDVTQCLMDDDIQGHLSDSDDGTISSSDNDFQVQGMAPTYLDLYQGRQIPALHQILSATAPYTLPSSHKLSDTILMSLSPGNPSPVDALFDSFGDVSNVSSDSSANGPPMRHISPLLLLLPMTPTPAPQAEFAATSAEIEDVKDLEAKLANRAEIIFRCQCCEAAQPGWASDHMDNIGRWEWDENSQGLRRKNVPIQ
ncbi:hypothetical protein C8T65DRAFT_832965 [Cerioporus squamosus]|nr:hypothetical protein C8T65DRAFT_832965 [Cerioporus squamosus]